MMDSSVIITIIVIAVLSVFLVYVVTKLILERRFRQQTEAQEQEWEAQKETIRREAIAQSRAVLGGRFIEQLVPYLPQFRYDPTEARFIGSPIDLIVFPGLATGNPQEIVIMEIKTGKRDQLTQQENKIRQLIEEGMVRWELIYMPSEPET